MIVGFTVTNFRSIRDNTVLTLLAGYPGTHLRKNIAYPTGGELGVVNSAGIYVANGSGKSNLFQAFETLRHIISVSANLAEAAPVGYYELSVSRLLPKPRWFVDRLEILSRLPFFIGAIREISLLMRP